MGYSLKRHTNKKNSTPKVIFADEEDDSTDGEATREGLPPTIKEIFAPLKENMDIYTDRRHALIIENLEFFVDMCNDNKQAALIVKDL